jgi:hypothetical protein
MNRKYRPSALLENFTIHFSRMTGTYLSIIVLTLALTAGFAMLVASADIEEIKANWAKRRCEIPVIIAGNLFKPSNDPKSPMDFSADNFRFCVRNLADEVIKVAFAPLMAIAGQQMNATSSMAGPLNSIRAMITQGMKSFSDVFATQYKQFTAVSILVNKTWQHIRFAMGRVGAIITSLVYLGLSASMLVQNTMKLILNVIMIFIGILAAMILLIWFGIIPFLVIIITMISLLASADSQTGGWISGGNADAGPFCVDPEADLVMADGSVKPLNTVNIGDAIASKNNNPNIVTGILRVDSQRQNIVSVAGVNMSETHPVFYNNTWMRACEHPEAIILDIRLKEVICLNTTEHSATMRGTSDIIVGDWDEASEIDDQKLWVKWASKILNGIDLQQSPPTTVPLCSNTVRVSTPENPWVCIDTIQIGDKILSKTGYTRVIGIYTGSFNASTNSPEWISDGVWMFTDKQWKLNAKGLPSDGSTIVSGRFLITESETFYIKTNESIELVRDFTEVGASRINECYSWFDVELNKKV